MSTQQNPLSLADDDSPSTVTQISGLLDAMGASMEAIRTLAEISDSSDGATRARQALTERTADLDAMLHAFGFSPDQAFGA